jgi:hypothetical protein
MLEPKPKSNCPVSGSPNANGYHGVAYGDLECFEPMACDDCGATWVQIWVRGRIDNIKTKTGLSCVEETNELS